MEKDSPAPLKTIEDKSRLVELNYQNKLESKLRLPIPKTIIADNVAENPDLQR